MNNKEYRDLLSSYRMEKQRLINNTYIWATLAIDSLRNISSDENRFKENIKFQIPSRRLDKSIVRTPDNAKKIIKNAVDKEIYFVLFTYIIAQFEGFLTDSISLILTYDRRRLRVNVQGNDNTKKIDVSELLDCSTHEDIIELIIERQLASLFYAGPKKQADYLEKVLSVSIEKSLWDKWFEFKATRDLIVHNSGVINATYIDKAGSSARGAIGQDILINKEYFDDACATVKSLIGKISTQAKIIKPAT